VLLLLLTPLPAPRAQDQNGKTFPDPTGKRETNEPPQAKDRLRTHVKIRREHEHGGGTIRGIAKKLGIHRRMVREAVLGAVPVERKTPMRARPKLEPAMAFVDAILEADKKAPRKQRHTAHRIWCRIRAEMPEVDVAESTIRRHVRERKIALALIHRETFIPQSYAWGAEGQVDWYEAYADICGERGH
jgi:hypothetical protein